MSRLLSLLLVDDAGHELVRFSPGSVVCLERDATDRWVIAWMLRPELFYDA
jgi:phosphohistidine phosphatase